MCLGMVECRIPFSGHRDLDHDDLRLSFWKNLVCSISLILFEVGIPNLVCGCRDFFCVLRGSFSAPVSMEKR